MRLRIGTRASKLAMAQAGQVAERLRAKGHEVVLVEVSTPGDRSSAPIPQLGVDGIARRARIDEQRDATDRSASARDLIERLGRKGVE